jgi:hypothetical protein
LFNATFFLVSHFCLDAKWKTMPIVLMIMIDDLCISHLLPWYTPNRDTTKTKTRKKK